MTSSINKILIANRGEIARRVIATCRAMGITTVAVHSDADSDAAFVQEADEAVALGGNEPAESYLRAEAVLDAAARTGADAIHPGYGFLAENADFSRQCADAGLIFIGPSPDSITRMGSKIEAKRLMEGSGVPVLPWAELQGVEAGSDELRTAAQGVGFPLLAKASAGGGGKGMRIVQSTDQLDAAVESSQREAASAFGDGTLFLERYLESPRHVEIQIFGDTHGNIVSLFERECSIQRRYQKIVEESPSVAVDDDLRQAMGAAAVAAGKAINYVGAGTVEFLLDADGRFYFLEVNTRLQVEHPVTECITGLDLVRLQILVAEGLPLPADALEPTISGHAIEVRLYAEDPENDFLPVVGTVDRFEFSERIDVRQFAPATNGGVRVDSAIVSGTQISPYYDPMIAKVIAHAPTRPEAARRLSVALREMELDGLRTNRDLLVRVLLSDDFLAGNTDTHFLQNHDPAELGATLLDQDGERIHACAAALTAQARRRRGAKVLGFMPAGWRNNPSQSQHATYQGEHGELSVQYGSSRDGCKLTVNDQQLDDVAVGAVAEGRVELAVGGVSRTYTVRHYDGTVCVSSCLGQSSLVEVDRFPGADDQEQAGSLLAPMPGKVIRVAVEVGDEVKQGHSLVVIEAMKMEHDIAAAVDGVVQAVHVELNQQVEAGALLAVLEEPE